MLIFILKMSSFFFVVNTFRKRNKNKHLPSPRVAESYEIRAGRAGPNLRASGPILPARRAGRNWPAGKIWLKARRQKLARGPAGKIVPRAEFVRRQKLACGPIFASAIYRVLLVSQ